MCGIYNGNTVHHFVENFPTISFAYNTSLKATFNTVENFVIRKMQHEFHLNNINFYSNIHITLTLFYFLVFYFHLQLSVFHPPNT